MNEILRKLLFQNKGQWQLAAAIVGTFLGLLLLLGAVQFYGDIQTLLKSDDSDTTQFVIINKRVNVFNTLGVRAAFSASEIEKLKAQPFVERIGTFIPNLYRVSASSEALSFYTELFFEAVDDAFIDIETSSFAWQEGQKELPVILSKDYLALYNFGFAPSQGLPQFTPSTIGRVRLDVQIGRQPNVQTFKGQVVGFSERIHSVLVPMSFMQWANEKYGTSTPKEPSRIIIQTNHTQTEQLNTFIEENGYELSGGQLISSQAASILKIVLVVLFAIGLLIFGLAVLAFILNFQLFVAQSKEDIRLLLQLGHTTDNLIRLTYQKLLWLFLGLIVVAILTLFVLRLFLLKWVSNQGFELNKILHPFVFIATIAIIILFLSINYQTIKRSVSSLSVLVKK